MSLTRVLRLLLEKRRLDKRLRARKAVRQVRSKAALKGVSTQNANRIERHRQTWGASA